MYKKLFSLRKVSFIIYLSFDLFEVFFMNFRILFSNLVSNILLGNVSMNWSVLENILYN